MQVFGDIERREDPGAITAEITVQLDRCRRASPGLDCHQLLVGAFIRASELVQGLLDADFATVGWDEVSEPRSSAESLMLQLAKAVVASWESGFMDLRALPDQTGFELLSRKGAVRTKLAEGYAFYALYPEAYVTAAHQSNLGPDTTVIGIRSIGVGLGAIVAATLGASAAESVRPVGHPFDRHLEIGPELASRLLARSGSFAVVDEGPGLSGSSFNCVADWLVAHGVAERRIHFFPSHAGDLGYAAHDCHRTRWQQAQKHVASFDQAILGATRSEHRLENWIADGVGPLGDSLRDLSGGAWRGPSSSDLQPADPAMEKRKFLAITGSGSWLAKFVGIGSQGENSFTLASTLADAGFSPPAAGLCHGFLVTPWVHPNSSRGFPPIQRVLDYLAFRSRLPPTTPGASLEQLFAMAVHNFHEHWGDPAADAVRKALGDPGRFTAVPCCTDNRMHAWEWVRATDGWQKLDSLDHHAAHDMVGCQDIAWDVAGAAVEFGLSNRQREALRTALSTRIGREVPHRFVAANELCYLGFQIGLWTMSLARNGEAEQRSTKALIARYEERARHALLRARLDMG